MDKGIRTMSERFSFLAFCALLVAICYLATVAAVLASNEQYAEALGFGGLTTGLVGVLGTFKPRTNAPDYPAPVNPSEIGGDELK